VCHTVTGVKQLLPELLLKTERKKEEGEKQEEERQEEGEGEREEK